MGPKVHIMDESVFDTMSERSAYWTSCLMADGCVYVGKRGYPRIELMGFLLMYNWIASAASGVVKHICSESDFLYIFILYRL